MSLLVGGVRLEVTALQAQDLRRQLGGVAVVDLPEPGRADVLTPVDAAREIAHSAKTVRKLCALPPTDPRHLRHFRKGTKILIRRSDLGDWVRRQIDRG